MEAFLPMQPLDQRSLQSWEWEAVVLLVDTKGNEERREASPSSTTPRQDIRNLTGPITECSESHPSILSSLLLKDNGERGKTRDCWQTSGPFSSSCLLALMEASCHAVSAHAEAHMARNPCLWPRASAALASASSHVSDPGRGSEPWDDTGTASALAVAS